MSASLLPPNPHASSVRVFRRFNLISFITIAVAGFVLALCFRYVSIESITRQSEASNLLVAQASRHAAHEDIADFLARLEKDPSAEFPAVIASGFFDLVKDTSVRKVKIYDRYGTVVFSTQGSEIGRHQSGNAGVVAALGGAVASQLIYRDAFNVLDGISAEDNFVQTYLPVQVEHQGKPLGVFEIYTDVSSIVAMSVNAQYLVAVISVLVMLTLYLFVLAIIRRTQRTIIVQQDALEERSDLLAALSTRMLNVHESENQRLAVELHERVAQTIAAVKMGVEGAIQNIRNGREALPMMETMVPFLQAAMQDVRLIALGLSPPSLHELGLMPTLQWRVRDYLEKHPEVSLDVELGAEEENVPEALRAIIYRVVDDALGALAGNPAIDRVTLSLSSDPQRILLVIGDDARDDDLAAVEVKSPSYLGARDRTLLSGGKFSLLHNAWGGITMQAIWLR
ncbi:MAG: histidine kinase [Azonexus sp.]